MLFAEGVIPPPSDGLPNAFPRELPAKSSENENTLEPEEAWCSQSSFAAGPASRHPAAQYWLQSQQLTGSGWDQYNAPQFPLAEGH